MLERAEDDLAFWFAGLDAALGCSGPGFDGGAVSVWDEARAGREHLKRWWGSSRSDVPRARRIEALLGMGIMPYRAALAAWQTCSASYFVRSHFSSQAFQAPLVGLGIVCWFELRPEESRAPIAIVQQWEIDLKSPDAEEFDSDHAKRKQAARRQQACKLIEPVRRRAVSRYMGALMTYAALQRWRADVDGSSRRARADARAERNAAFAASLARQRDARP